MAGRGINGAIMRGLGMRDHDARVVGVEAITPEFVRIRLVSETLFDDVAVGPTAWIRLWFPDPDSTGSTGTGTEHQRAYTLSAADPETGEFAIDVVLHEPSGPASAWARRAEAGQAIQVSSSATPNFALPTETPRGLLLIGDAASLPAIDGILRVVPPEMPVELYLEQHRPGDADIPRGTHPRLRTHWVPREDEGSIARAIEARDWSDWHVWAAPESGSLKHLRTRLREEFGFPKGEIHARAYWYEGRAFGSRRSRADERAARAELAAHAEQAERGQRDEPAERDQQAGIQPTAPVPSDVPTPVPSDVPAPAPSATAARPGSWRSQSAGRLLRPLRGRLALAGVVQGLVTLLELSPFVLLTELARRLLQGAGAEELARIGGLAVGLMALGVVLATALMVATHLVDARFERDLRQNLLGKIARLPLGWFDRRTSGQVKQLIQGDTLSLHYLITHAVPDGVAAVVAPVAVLLYLLAVDWRLALVLLVPVLVYVITMYRMVLQSLPRMGPAAQWAERMSSEAGEYLEGQPVVRVFGGAAASTFRRRLAEYVEFLGDWQRPFSAQKATMDLATRPTTFLMLIVLAGTLLVTSGGMDPVDLLPFLLLGTAFGARLLGIGYGLSGLRDGLAAAKRLQIVLDEPELAAAAPAPAPGPSAPVPAGRVEIDGVSFAYRPGVPVLEDVSLQLEPRTVTALVGPSGSGKSTLAALLARFHDVDAGAIRIGGDDVRDLDADALYTRIGFVFQQTQLVRGSVRENIALAVPDASDERIVAAARAAQIHERILALPRGYDTELGPDAALSGGERQRLTIARALLADTPVLVMDEATAFADPESEHLVQQALNRLTAGRTVLVIAHRLHTITGADRIVVLDEGRVAESGTHTELLAADGRYAQLWAADASRAPHLEGERR
ncbi:ABC transporter ATP-binding protein/permease [Brachybacterium sp. DNPG3]